MALREELLNLERGFWKSASDPDYYREHMADDALAVFAAPAGVMNKEQAVASMDEGTEEMNWSNFEFNDVRAVHITDNVVALTYTGEAMRGETPYSANVASVYVQRDGNWQLVLHQQSVNAPVPATV
jgi:hypothetical protein